jgi:hypothetical protein
VERFARRIEVTNHDDGVIDPVNVLPHGAGARSAEGR